MQNIFAGTSSYYRILQSKSPLPILNSSLVGSTLKSFKLFSQHEQIHRSGTSEVDERRGKKISIKKEKKNHLNYLNLINEEIIECVTK